MRSILIENFGNIIVITDWNFKKWTLQLITNSYYDCGEIGASFRTPEEFIIELYGKDQILRENNQDCFINYIIVTDH